MKGIEILTNVRKDAKLVNPETGEFLELDIYIPSLHLALEYHVIFSSTPPSFLTSFLSFIGNSSLQEFRVCISAIGGV